MLNSNIKLIKIPKIADYQVIYSHSEKTRVSHVIITGISESEEEVLNKKGRLKLERSGQTFNVPYKSVYCFGEIDFHTNSDDMKQIRDLDWLKHRTGMLGVCVPLQIDLDRNVFVGEGYFDTWCSDLIAQYHYALLGQPKRVVIFQEQLDIHGHKRT